MKFTLISLALVALVASSAYAIVCPPDACATVRCAAVTAENCDGKIVQNGGYCGCCDKCVTLIQPGEPCLSVPLLGVPESATCVNGYYCSPKTNTCEILIIN